jgi:hypothetical protein
MSVTQLYSEVQKGAVEFINFARPKHVIVITVGSDDEIQAQAWGDMSKAEMIGVFEIAKLMAVDEV